MSELLAGERLARESDRAVAACNDYLLMGPGRSQRKLLNHYVQQASSESPAAKPPTVKLNTLTTWSNKFDWVERAQAYDAALAAKEAAQIEAERARLRSEGLAADYERIRKLGELAELLFAELYEEVETKAEESAEEGAAFPLSAPTFRRRPKLWLRDVKQIGGGDSATLEEVFRYNSALVGDVRGVLDDLAKETGGRKQRSEMSNLNIDMASLTDEQLKRIADGEDPYRVLASA